MAYTPISLITTPNAYGNTISPGSIFAQVTGYGTLRVSDEPSTLLFEPFDSTLETTNTWNTPTQVSGATVTVGSGGVTLTGGTTGGAIGSLDSIPKFVGLVPGFLQVSFAIKLESVATTSTAYTATASRFWGVGSPGTTGVSFTAPTTTTPLYDAVGFEIDFATGNLLAVVYASGVRTTVANFTTNGVIKNDGAYHRYLIQSRTDRVFWYIDSLDAPLAISNFTFPTTQTLAVRMAVVNRPATPSTTSIICTGLAVADTGKPTMGLNDGTYRWRKAKVDALGNLATINTGVVSTSNSTIATLAANATFTGAAWEDVSNYGAISVVINANVPSANNGVKFLWSTDGATIDDTETFSYAVGGYSFTLPPEAQYFKVQYVNGATLQGTFHLQTIYKSASTHSTIGRVRQSNPAAQASDGQRLGLITDGIGRLVTTHGHVRQQIGRQSTTITSSTVATTIVAAAAGVFNDLSALTITNSSTTATLVTISDGTTASIFSIAANGGMVLSLHTPISATNAGVAWTAQCGTSVASIYITAIYIKNV